MIVALARRRERWRCAAKGTLSAVYSVVPRLGGDDPKLGRSAGGLEAGVDAELGVDSGEVVADRLGGQVEPLGDLGVPQSFGNQGQHLGFAGGQASRMGSGGSPGTAAQRREVVDPKGAQATDGVREGRLGLEPLEGGDRLVDEIGIIATGQGTGFLVGAAERLPERSRRDTVTGD